MVRDLSGSLLFQLFQRPLRYWSCGLEGPDDEEGVDRPSVEWPHGCLSPEADLLTASE